MKTFLLSLATWPIFMPILRLLNSRKFILSAATTIVVLTSGLPIAQTVQLVVITALTLIGGITIEDTMKAIATAKTLTPGQAISDTVEAIKGAEFPPDLAAILPGLTPEQVTALLAWLFPAGVGSQVNISALSRLAAIAQQSKAGTTAAPVPKWIEETRVPGFTPPPKPTNPT